MKSCWSCAKTIEDGAQTCSFCGATAPASTGKASGDPEPSAPLGSIEPPSQTLSIAPLAPSGVGGWHYAISEHRRGPIPLAELQALVRSGQLGRSALVWSDGMPA